MLGAGGRPAGGALGARVAAHGHPPRPCAAGVLTWRGLLPPRGGTPSVSIGVRRGGDEPEAQAQRLERAWGEQVQVGCMPQELRVGTRTGRSTTTLTYDDAMPHRHPMRMDDARSWVDVFVQVRGPLRRQHSLVATLCAYSTCMGTVLTTHIQLSRLTGIDETITKTNVEGSTSSASAAASCLKS